MKIWNYKYDIDHEELEEKIGKLAEELSIMKFEIESELELVKEQHEDWDIDRLLEEVKKYHVGDKLNI